MSLYTGSRRLVQAPVLRLLARSRPASGEAAVRDVLQRQLEAIQTAGTWKGERVITSKQAALISVSGTTDGLLNFCANNYLGLSSHSEVVNAAKAALDCYGAGLSSVRFICGTQDIHKELERELATFHGREDAILYSSCFDANAGIFEALLTNEDCIISDELNHASIIDGIRLCKAKKFRYLNCDMGDLEDQLKSAEPYRTKLVATDGVFSMDGKVAPLRTISELAAKYGAILFIDECHATGVLGAFGTGTEEFLGVPGVATILNSTLGKALGGAAGGYTTGPSELIQLLRQRSRPYLFSNSLPPAVVATGLRSLQLIQSDRTIRERLAENTTRFRRKMKSAGFTINGDDHPICPVMLGDARLAHEFSEQMLTKGIYVVGFSHPVVPVGKARIRVQISGAHSSDDVDRLIDAFKEVGRKLKVIQL